VNLWKGAIMEYSKAISQHFLVDLSTNPKNASLYEFELGSSRIPNRNTHYYKPTFIFRECGASRPSYLLTKILVIQNYNSLKPVLKGSDDGVLHLPLLASGLCPSSDILTRSSGKN
jgi:hypothetical protein